MKGRAQKCSINRQEKLGGRVQKTQKKYMIFQVLVPEMEKLVIFVFRVENTDAPHNVSQCALECVKRHHTHNSVFFCLFYFYWRYYNKYFVINNIPANQIIISTYSYLLYKFSIKLKKKSHRQHLD